MKACPGCQRHVRASESCCPFCDAPLRESAAPRLAVVLGLASMLAGCGGTEPSTDSGAGSSDTGNASSPASSSSGEDPGNTVTSGGTAATGSFDTEAVDSDDTATDTNGGGGFIYGSPDDGGPMPDCDPQANDCPEGEKCSPWASDGGKEWDATRCVPVAPDPAAPGEACLAVGSPVSGLDDCESGSVCVDVDPRTLQGVCREICLPPVENSPTCAPTEVCVITNQASVPFCEPSCDPAAPMCPAGTECFEFGEGGPAACL